MKLIAAVSDDWGIGFDNNLLFKIKEDMQFFKEKTTGHAVVMGRKTYESIGKPLPNRENYVLTRNTEYYPDNIHMIHDISEIPEDAYIIGGANIYEMMLPYCDTAYITKIHASKPCNKYFPNLDENKDWKIDTSTPCFKTTSDIYIEFITYKRKIRN